MSNLIYQPKHTGRSLQEMFAAQKLLMEKYIKLEDLPSYPLDLSLRKNQKLLKNFAYRVIEELGEAYDFISQAFTFISGNSPDNAADSIEQANEEIADAWHFFLELMVFSGVNEHDIYGWVDKTLNESPQWGGLMHRDKMLAGFLNIAEFLNQQEGLAYQSRDKSLYTIFSENQVAEEPWNAGGRKLSAKVVDNTAKLMWETTFRITITMNCLKARDWHKTENKTVNTILYNERIMDAFIALCRLMAYLGKSELSIYNSYLRKNLINFERFKTQ